MGFFKEFKEFAIRGNVVDLAVGVVMGGAFGAIVTSLVNDIIMPPLGKLISNVNFSELKFVLSEAVIENGEVIKPEAAIMWGNFVQTVVSFLIIAFAIFVAIKGLNSLKKKEEKKPAAPSEEILLLREIRDSLKK